MSPGTGNASRRPEQRLTWSPDIHLPLDTDIANTTPDEISALAYQMNATPRKSLDYKTPEEVFQEFVTKAHGSNILETSASHFE